LKGVALARLALISSTTFHVFTIEKKLPQREDKKLRKRNALFITNAKNRKKM